MPAPAISPRRGLDFDALSLLPKDVRTFLLRRLGPEAEARARALYGGRFLGEHEGAQPPGLDTTRISESPSGPAWGPGVPSSPPEVGARDPGEFSLNPRNYKPLAKKKLRDRRGARRYIKACHEGRWHLSLSKFDGKTGVVTQDVRVPFKCHSWRHEGDCRRWIASQNYARLNEALGRYQDGAISFMVLTLDPRKWKDRWQAFEELVQRWRAFAKWIKRNYGYEGYCSTVEVHRSGWPHLNVVLVSPRLGHGLEEDQDGVRRELVAAAVRCGFGSSLHVEKAKSREAVAGYAVKVAGEVEQCAKEGVGGQMVGEVVKLSQLPTEAPAHFRRLRSSRGFLPASHKPEGNWTGQVVKTPCPPPEPKAGEQVELKLRPPEPVHERGPGMAERVLWALEDYRAATVAELMRGHPELFAPPDQVDPPRHLEQSPFDVVRDAPESPQKLLFLVPEHLAEGRDHPLGGAPP